MAQKKFKTYDIYVGNLPLEYDQKHVTRLFSKVGEINAVIVRENNGQKHAYVRFISEADAENACEKNGTIAEGKKIIVRRSEAKKKSPEDGQDKKARDNDSGSSDWNAETESAPGATKETEDKTGAAAQKGKGRGETMMITHVESPVMYWGQGVTDANMSGLLSVANELKQLCPAAPTLTGPPELNKVYGAKFSEDDNWYRCQVVAMNNPKRVKIQYIDYGNYEEVNPETLVELPSSVASLRPFAQKCLLHEILPSKRNDTAGIEFVRNLLENQYIQVVPRRRLADQKGNYVDIFLGDVFLNEKIVESGYGVRRILPQRNNQFGSPIPNSGGNATAAVFHLAGAFPAVPPSDFVIGGGFGGGDMDSVNSIPPSALFPAVVEQSKKPPFIGFDSSVPPPPAPNRVAQAELSAKNREMEKLRAEKEKSSMEVQLLRNKMKSLQGEYAQVSKMMENNFSSLMQQSYELKQRVRSLRVQFPAASREVPLEKAIALLTDEELDCDAPPSFRSAIAKLLQYNKMQVEIFKCSSMDEMTAKLSPRNEIRHEVYEHLMQGIEDLETMPLSEKRDALKRGLEILRKNYAAYFKFNVQGTPPLNSLVQGYKQFRDEKIKRFEESRKATDEVGRNLKNLFGRIQLSLDLDQEPEWESQDSLCPQLEALLKTFNQALQQEIQISDIENSSEGCLMAALVQGLEKSIHAQFGKVEELYQKLVDFRQTRDSIEKWLSATPSVDPINESRKTLRGLKSKLRHRLADLEDAVESGDAQAVQSIEDDIAAIRLSIHKTLIEEDRELTQLTSLADNHFPELLLQYPDLGIKAFKDNGCLVKPSLEPDHLDMQPVPGLSTPLFQSTFADTPVLVREHLLGDPDRLSKEEFLKELKHYSKIKMPHLQPIQAVFFDKTARHAYVKTSKSGELLCNFVAQQGRCSKEMIQGIFRCLVSAVISLHAEKMVHGEVTPENVLVLPSGGALLMEPDFSRSRLERSRRKYVSANGLEFLSPELKALSTSTSALYRGDCYNLGMLLIWMHCPDQGLHFLPNGLPSAADVLDSSVLEVLTLLMTPNPKLEQGLDPFILNTRFLGQPGQIPRTVPSPLPPDATPPPRPMTSQSAMMERAALIGQQCRTPTPPTRASPSPPSQVPPAPQPQLRSFLPSRPPPPQAPSSSNEECVIDTFDPSLADNLPATTASHSEEAPLSDSSGWDPEPVLGGASAQSLGRRLQPMRSAVDDASMPPLESSQVEDGDQLGENGWGTPDPNFPDSGTGWEDDGDGEASTLDADPESSGLGADQD